jgi:hypothetical protein
MHKIQRAKQYQKQGFWETVQCDRQPIACAIWGCLGAIILSQPSNQILDHSVQNHPKPVSFLSSGVPSESGLSPLNSTIDHTYICIYINLYTVDTSGVNHLTSQICHNRLFRKKFQHNLLRMTSTEISYLARHNTVIQSSHILRQSLQ